jgi:hypothetical protein
MPLFKVVPVYSAAPTIESVSDDGQVEVVLANGERSVLQVPIEQVEQLRRAAFAEYRERNRAQWESESQT